MGMDLVRSAEVYSIGDKFWRECLELAIAFGWRPAGTLHAIADLEHFAPEIAAIEQKRRIREWSGIYTSNDWQRVTDEDAYALSLTLHKAVAVSETGLEMTEAQSQAFQPILLDLVDARRFGPDNPVTRLADFLGGGGFEIG
jgi:hypothetical protein